VSEPDSTAPWYVQEARRLAGRLKPADCAMANALISIVRVANDPVAAAEQVLTRDYPSGGSQPQWSNFRRVVTPAVVRDLHARHGVDGVITVLTWIKRLGRIEPARGGAQTKRPAGKSASTPRPGGRHR
jgi:hypothetical protein